MNEGKRVLIVSWDGAGNLVPTFGIAERLASNGHDVRILGHPTIGERLPDPNWRFRPFTHMPPLDSSAPCDVAAETDVLGREVWFNPKVAMEVIEELDREPADVLLADCMLYPALIAGQSRLPTIALFHTAISIFRGGPLHEMLSEHLSAVNELRGELGQPPAESITDVHDACSLSLVTTPREFDVSIPLPGNVRFVGPVLDGPPIHETAVDVPVVDGPLPLVVVSFSTGFQDQRECLQGVVDALRSSAADVVVTTGATIRPDEIASGGNIRVVGFVAHGQLIPKAQVVVTHAGLGTLMMALSHGVPVVCVPMGRDQYFNAAMVDRLGVGRVVEPGASPGDIRRTVEDLLTNYKIRQAAKDFSSVIAKYEGGDEAVRELARL